MDVALFAFGTFMFWALVVAVSIIILVALEIERGVLAVFGIGLFLAMIHIWGGANVAKLIAQNPLAAGICGVAYLVGGTFWGISKWWSYVKNQRRKYNEAFEDYTRDFNKNPEAVMHRLGRRRLPIEERKKKPKLEPETPEWKAAFKNNWQVVVEDGTYGGTRFEYKPSHRRHKGDILRWMSFWPWSLVWTVLNDPFKAIYRRIANLLSNLSESAFKGTEEFDPENPKNQRRVGDSDDIHLDRMMPGGPDELDLEFPEKEEAPTKS